MFKAERLRGGIRGGRLDTQEQDIERGVDLITLVRYAAGAPCNSDLSRPIVMVSLMLHLSTVVDTFELSGRSSIIVAPGIPKHGECKWMVRVSEPVMLEAPDGTTLHTIIGGIEMLSPPHPDFIPVMLGPGVSKQMVPIGTKIWVNETTTL